MMAVIQLQTGKQLDAAICPLCAGNAKVFPASALESHLRRHYQMFSARVRYRGGGNKGNIIRKRMSPTGIEFRLAIKNGGGAREKR